MLPLRVARACWLSVLLIAAPALAEDQSPTLSVPGKQWQGTRDHVVQPGETLGKIVMSRYPDLRGNWQRIIGYIVETNPAAFPQQNPDRLQPGVLISVPDFDEPPAPESEPELPRLPVIGAVVKGTPRIVDRYQRSSTRIAGDAVHEGDIAFGGSGSVSVIRLIDGSTIEVRPDSEVELSAVSYGQGSAGKIVLKLIKGGLRMVSGLFGKQSDSQVEVRTPGGVIGVRGTDFAVRHCEGDSCAAETDALGSVIGLLNGALAMNNGAVSDFAIAPRDVFLVADESSVPEPRPDLAGLLFSAEDWPAQKRPCVNAVNRTGPRLRCP